MSEENKNPLSLLKELLEICEKERSDLDACNLEKLEHYSLAKQDIMRKLKEMETLSSWVSDKETSSEVEIILKSINEVNNANAAVVREKKDEVLGQIKEQKKRHTAVDAYNKLS